MNFGPEALPENFGATTKLYDKLVAQVTAQIKSSETIPAELKDEIVGKLFNNPNVPIVFASSTSHTGKGAGRGRRFATGQTLSKTWVVRTDNLKMIEGMSTIALAIATYVASTTATIEVFAVTLLFSVVALAYKLRQKNADDLSESDYQLLMALKAAPCNAVELSTLLSGLHIYGSGVWTEETTLAALKRLQSVRLKDGSVEALVVQAGDGLWSTNGI